MAKFMIVVDDADKAHEFERRQYRDAFMRARVRPQLIEAMVDERIAKKRPAGTVHAEAHDACPDGLPNCRDCGDPAHRDACAAAGHCPHCGTQHGIAPSAVLAANGFRLVEVE